MRLTLPWWKGGNLPVPRMKKKGRRKKKKRKNWLACRGQPGKREGSTNLSFFPLDYGGRPGKEEREGPTPLFTRKQDKRGGRKGSVSLLSVPSIARKEKKGGKTSSPFTISRLPRKVPFLTIVGANRGKGGPRFSMCLSGSEKKK